MNWRNNSLFLLLSLSIVSCNDKDSKNKYPLVGEEVVINAEETSSYLIETDDLLSIFKNDNIKIIDFRKPEFYNQEHIRGAINIWRTDIEDSSYSYGGMMASKEQLEALFSNLGIQNNDTLIIYDDNGLCDSARLWWILQNYDYHNVKLLHGGMADWSLMHGPTSTRPTISEKTNFKLNDHPSMKLYISKEELEKY